MNIELNTEGCHYYICDCDNSPINKLPWGDKECNVYLLNLQEAMVTSERVQSLINELVLKKTDWFYTLGPKSEWLHDQIDLASVRSGRQKAVGDGSPMTSWHEDVNTVAEMANFVCPATNDFCVILIIGNIKDFEQFMTALIHELFNSNSDDIEK